MFKVGLIGCGKISVGQINGLKTIDDVPKNLRDEVQAILNTII